MKNKVLTVVIIMLLAVSMIILNKYLNNINNEEEYMQKEENSGKNEIEIIKVTSDSFEEEVLNSSKTVLIDFYADWCGPCKAYAPIVEAVASENEDIKVVKINIDEAQDIAMKYQVMSIPTTVIIKNGKEVDRGVGIISKKNLIEMLK